MHRNWGLLGFWTRSNNNKKPAIRWWKMNLRDPSVQSARKFSLRINVNRLMKHLKMVDRGTSESCGDATIKGISRWLIIRSMKLITTATEAENVVGRVFSICFALSFVRRFCRKHETSGMHSSCNVRRRCHLSRGSQHKKNIFWLSSAQQVQLKSRHKTHW